jgi:hypothetical protein
VTNALIHFAIGFLGALIIFITYNRLAGIERFSLPIAPIVIGIACAAFARFFTPWATPAVLFLYALGSYSDLRRDRGPQ